MDGDPVVLSFHDVCVRQSDVHLLTGPFWLNDTLISFCFEYFRNVQFSEKERKIQRICFVTPDVVQLAKFYETDSLKPIVEPLKWPEHELILFPVNDHSSSSSAGGTHWSLLVYKKSSDSFEHYDSSVGLANYKVAVQIARLVHPIFCWQKKKTKVTNVGCPQQRNGYDCGVFLVYFAESVAQNFIQNRNSSPVSNDISCYREKIRQLVYDLKEQT